MNTILMDFYHTYISVIRFINEADVRSGWSGLRSEILTWPCV